MAGRGRSRGRAAPSAPAGASARAPAGAAPRGRGRARGRAAPSAPAGASAPAPVGAAPRGRGRARAVYIEQVCNEALKIGETHGASGKDTSQSLLDEQNQVYDAVKKTLLQSDTLSAKKLRAAGDMIKRIYCDRKISYESLYEHPIMFPPAPQQTFVDAFTEADTSSKCLKEKDKQFQYEAECDLYRALEGLKSVTRKIIVLHNFKFSKEQAKVFMGNSKSSLGAGEHDFVVIVRNRGIVLFEVKAPAVITDRSFKRNLDDSRKKQLKRGAELIDGICKTCDIDKSVTKFKVFQFTAFPRASKEQVAHFQSYQKLPVADSKQIIFQDEIQNFRDWWFYNVSNDLEEEINSMGQLESTLLGLWCINQKNICNIDICSLGYCITQIDNALKAEQISRNVSAPVSKNIRASRAAVFRPFRDYLDITCLTQEQVDIFKDSKPHCQLIIGQAGSGKTILLLGKIIELAKRGETCFLFSGSLQSEKYKKIFTDAGLESYFAYEVVNGGQQVRTFNLTFDDDLDKSGSGSVIILYHWQQYEEICNLYKFEKGAINVFIDDLHVMLSLQISELSEKGVRDEVKLKNRLFSDIMQCMKVRMDNNISKIFWVMFDHMQLNVLFYHVDIDTAPNLTVQLGHYCKQLFDNLMKECTDNKELFRFLTANLRNTFEINRLVDNLTYCYNGVIKDHSFLNLLPKNVTGHFIHGTKPSLIYLSTTDATKELLLEVIHEELYKLLKMGDHKLEPKDVAVLDGRVTFSDSSSMTKPDRDHLFTVMSERLTEFGDVIIRRTDSPILQSSEWKAVILILSASTISDLYDSRQCVDALDTLIPGSDFCFQFYFASTSTGVSEYFYVSMTRARTYLSIVIEDDEKLQFDYEKLSTKGKVYDIFERDTIFRDLS